MVRVSNELNFVNPPSTSVSISYVLVVIYILNSKYTLYMYPSFKKSPIRAIHARIQKNRSEGEVLTAFILVIIVFHNGPGPYKNF